MLLTLLLVGLAAVIAGIGTIYHFATGNSALTWVCFIIAIYIFSLANKTYPIPKSKDIDDD
ncbi:MAG: hypothetical protein OSB62_01200 [Alphaproteobacteria bacterium]|nr:hypothetical protein [Alphaproteobacteria bacterium]